MTNQTANGKKAMLRVVLAGIGTLLTALFAAVLWVLAQAQYINDYCSTRAPQPTSPTPEALDGRPAYMDGPVTVVCEYHELPTVEVTDALPFIGACLLAVVVLAIGVWAFRWALRPTDSAGLCTEAQDVDQQVV